MAYDLTKMGDIYVIGGGKGSVSIARGLEDILRDRIKRGLIIEKRHGHKLSRIKVVEGAHSVPDEEGVKGSEEIREIALNAKKNDLVFVCVTGGCSALMTLPAQGVSLKDIQKVTIIPKSF